MRVWLALLGTVSLLVIGSRAIAGNPPAPRENPGVAPKPVLVRPVAVAGSPSASDNGLIAVRGPGAVYLVDPARGSVRKVPGTADMDEPAWSPNGTLLAVDRTDKGGSSVYTIRPDGAHPQLVLRNASSPSWSANGKRLFVERGGVSDDDASPVFISVRPDGSDAHEVNFEDEDFNDVREPAWPTDGNYISFFADESTASSPASFDSSAAAWSPDGTQVAFSSSGLWVVGAEGGKPRLIATGDFGRPSWGTFQPTAARAPPTD